ncbi:MAG: hypothetical protein EOM20_10095 [Spartobacteria bacterium]|nr:hypothetical protein [Spartobacteria bacterium]
MTATQCIAAAVVLSVMIGVPYSMAVLIVAFVVTSYSIVGGLWSVTLTDFVQIFLIVIGMAIAVPYALSACGGWDTLVSQLPAERMSFLDGVGIKTIISLIVMYTVSFCVGQEAVQRYYAAKTDKPALGGSLIASGIYVVFAFVPTVLGLACFILVKNGNTKSIIALLMFSFSLRAGGAFFPGLIASFVVFITFSLIRPCNSGTQLAVE